MTNYESDSENDKVRAVTSRSWTSNRVTVRKSNRHAAVIHRECLRLHVYAASTLLLPLTLFHELLLYIEEEASTSSQHYSTFHALTTADAVAAVGKNFIGPDK